jgi:hypothetical protein
MPFKVVRAWLAHLLRSHNVTTISTTGHSLGGALSTVSAFAIGRELDRLWAVGNESERADFKVQRALQGFVCAFGAALTVVDGSRMDLCRTTAV